MCLRDSDSQLIRSHAEHCRTSRHPWPASGRQWKAHIGSDECSILHATIHEVHDWSAHKSSHKSIRWSRVALTRRAELLHYPKLHDHHAVCKRHGLFLVVCHIHHARASAAVKLTNLCTHFNAQSCIKIRERFVKEEHLWLTHECAPEGNALTLATRQCARQAPKKRFYSKRARGIKNFAINGGKFCAPFFAVQQHASNAAVLPSSQQSKRHVLLDRHVRVERIVLKDHRYIAVLRR